MIHRSVLIEEVIEYLNPQKNENIIDCTIGEGGHALEILKKNGPEGKLLGIDWDPNQLEKARNNLKEFQDRIVLVNDSYSNLEKIVKEKEFYLVKGVFFDLGMSSRQIERSERGFSFRKDELLDMRYNLKNPLTAEIIVNQWPEKEVESILREYGEEKYAKRIARAIASRRKIKPFKTSRELTEAIKRAVPSRYLKGKISPATRTFQALRIAVNNELGNIRDVLPQAQKILSNKGRMVIISFHSLEDRIVKQYFKKQSEDLKILTPKPVRAKSEEEKNNIRARSAKLRAAEKIWQKQQH
jgi:16S rRNA (cytosine1402-N4)-methyltransferase